jgi:two-component system, OmpR family, aerobic respiration control sensor histidine kinase ArcB
MLRKYHGMDKNMLSKKTNTKNIFLEKLVANMPGHVYWKDLNGKYLGVNAQQAKSAGYSSSEEMIGKTDYDNLSKDEADSIRKLDMEVISAGKMQVIEETISAYAGGEATFLSQKMPLKDEHGKIIGLFGISLDITDYKRMEARLKGKTEQIEMTLETLIDKMPGHVYWRDCNGIYLGCNEQQVNSSGFQSKEDIVGKNIYDLLPLEEAERVIKLDMEVIETKKPHVVEEVGIYNNQAATFLSQKVPLVDKKGEVTGILGISFDITDRKRAEEQLKEALEAKANFMALMSHELLGPMSNIIGMLDLIKPILEDKPELAQFLDAANTEALRSLSLLKNVTSLLELDKGTLEQKQHEIDIHFALQRLLDLISVNDGVKKILDIDKSVSEILWVDVLNLDKVLNILLENAARFTTQGHITVSAKGDGSVLTICVEDTGMGIEKSHQENLFNHFVSTDALTDIEQRYKKAGVRLPVAKKLIELIGGTLHLSSKVGAGTKMTITVPYRESKNKQIRSDKQEMFDEEEAIVIPPLKILMVEDDSVCMMAQSFMLTQIGCRVTEVTTGLAAVKRIKSEKFDLIFLDITLSDINGIEVARRMHDVSADLDIVAVTSHSEERDVANFISHGIFAVLPKPVSTAILTDFLKSYVRAKKERD